MPVAIPHLIFAGHQCCNIVDGSEFYDGNLSASQYGLMVLEAVVFSIYLPLVYLKHMKDQTCKSYRKI